MIKALGVFKRYSEKIRFTFSSLDKINLKWFHWIELVVTIILCISIFFPSYSPLYWLYGPAEADWSFSIEGLVNNPYTITYREMLMMPATNVEDTLLLSKQTNPGSRGKLDWNSAQSSTADGWFKGRCY